MSYQYRQVRNGEPINWSFIGAKPAVFERIRQYVDIIKFCYDVSRYADGPLFANKTRELGSWALLLEAAL